MSEDYEWLKDEIDTRYDKVKEQMRMNEYWLILHKVRGEPAFDIATKLGIEDDECYIIPTSGHRAYPVVAWRLSYLDQDTLLEMYNTTIPPDWPDHYGTKAEPKQDLRAVLGLNKPTYTKRAI